MIDLWTSLPVLFGDNIGTTITAVLASLGASVAAKRTAVAHVIFNVLGTILFLFALRPVYQLVLWAGTITDVNIRMQIAYAHGFFNITNVLIQLPFIGILAYIVTKIVPGSMKIIDFTPKHLDERLLNNPSVGLGQAQHEIIRMGETARDCLHDASNYFLTRDVNTRSMAVQREELINMLDKKITDYIVKLQQNAMNEQESAKASILMQSINDIERIGDHAENIMELGDYSEAKKVEFSDEAIAELNNMISKADEIVVLALEALDKHEEEKAKAVLELEVELDQLERTYRKSHIKRLNQNLCSGNSGAVFLDILSNLERVGDHCKNIAQYVLYGE